MSRIATEHGISLIEVLAAVTVFALVAAGAAAGTIATIRGNATSRGVSEATALIHDKIEQLRALDPTGNPADLTSGVHNDPLNPMNPLGQAGGTYSRSWTVVRDSPRHGLAEVTLTVSWRDSRPRTLKSATYLCLTPTCV